ncbi:MAG: ABC transporter ATP-binding protein [Lachnospiraceae bacterium]|jgi:putative ABC transport system ATP-binding protein|nr:ABC transporter ATP-binding protein [Lachnospiraceae bacterium]
MIKVSNAVKYYKDGEKKIAALSEVSLTVGNNELVVILGPSGSGKSTLINVMSALDRCDMGKIEYDGTVITDLPDRKMTRFRRDNVGFIFQEYYLLPDLTVENNIRMGASLAKNTDYGEIISMLDLDQLMKRMPYQLSGGQQQRVAIARALAKKPQVLFCDEPTGALDEATGKQVLSLLQDYQRKNNIAIVMVTHNQGIAAMASKVVRMNSGRIISEEINQNIADAADVRWA